MIEHEFAYMNKIVIKRKIENKSRRIEEKEKYLKSFGLKQDEVT